MTDKFIVNIYSPRCVHPHIIHKTIKIINKIHSYPELYVHYYNRISPDDPLQVSFALMMMNLEEKTYRSARFSIPISIFSYSKSLKKSINEFLKN